MNSLRPYFNLGSKSWETVSLDTTIKRQAVMDALKKTRTLKARTTGVAKTSNRKAQESFLLRFPPEIRNEIYALALDSASEPASTTLVTPSSGAPDSNSNGMGVLRLCKEITVEARSILEGHCVSYIPIMGNTDFNSDINLILEHGNAALNPVQSTIFAGLTSFMSAHLHLHISHTPSEDPEDPELHIDLRIRHIYGILRQAIIVWGCASEENFTHLKASGMKRKATVHLDISSPTDTATEWELRYYVFAGGKVKIDNWTYWDERLRKPFENIKGMCEGFPNIKLVAEVYGELKWSLEGSEGVTRSITPSSRLWPSWPEHVPWRLFPRVRSDQRVACH
ncbi:hypothetical protein P3342_009569 [Pyrenophora teres f. teres]|nr:hypothetical protein P3342_009569 [Pyrenophora teres f. teres]